MSGLRRCAHEQTTERDPGTVRLRRAISGAHAGSRQKNYRDYSGELIRELKKVQAFGMLQERYEVPCTMFLVLHR